MCVPSTDQGKWDWAGAWNYEEYNERKESEGQKVVVDEHNQAIVGTRVLLIVYCFFKGTYNSRS